MTEIYNPRDLHIVLQWTMVGWLWYVFENEHGDDEDCLAHGKGSMCCEASDDARKAFDRLTGTTP